MSLKSAAITMLVALVAAGTAPAQPVEISSQSPLHPSRTLTFTGDWTVGGDDGEFIFGMMIDSLEDGAGNVYLLDSQLGQVEAFTATGEHLRTLSGKGDGPGEVRNPQNLFLLPGGSLGILEFFPAKLVTLSLDGVPGPSVTLDGGAESGTGMSTAFTADCNGGVVLLAAHRSLPAEQGLTRTQYLARITPEGREVCRYREAHTVLDFSQFVFKEEDILPGFLLAAAVGPDGRVYTVRDRQQYAVEVYSPDGELEMVIHRDFEPLPRDQAAMRRLNALVDAWIQGIPGEVKREFDPAEPPITDLHVDDDGVLWVQHARSGVDQPEGVFLSFDTFDPQGRWLQEVRIRAEGEAAYDGIRFLGGDRALLVKGYALARWASRGALNADFGEDGAATAMAVSYGHLVE